MVQDKTFFLVLLTVLERLQAYEVTIYGDVPLNGQLCRAHIFSKRGEVIGSTIERSGQLLFQGEEAFSRVRGHREWRVRFESAVENALHEYMSRFQALSISDQEGESEDLGRSDVRQLPITQPLSLFVPKQKAELDMEVLASLSSKQRFMVRSVLTMVNGERSIEQIKSMLGLKPTMVDECLEYLRNIDVVELLEQIEQ